ncbi:hypothetical protein F4803DRAFT_527226, partial [Xylaria telfairii]
RYARSANSTEFKVVTAPFHPLMKESHGIQGWARYICRYVSYIYLVIQAGVGIISIYISTLPSVAPQWSTSSSWPTPPPRFPPVGGVWLSDAAPARPPTWSPAILNIGSGAPHQVPISPSQPSLTSSSRALAALLHGTGRCSLCVPTIKLTGQ